MIKRREREPENGMLYRHFQNAGFWPSHAVFHLFFPHRDLNFLSPFCIEKRRAPCPKRRQSAGFLYLYNYLQFHLFGVFGPGPFDKTVAVQNLKIPGQPLVKRVGFFPKFRFHLFSQLDNIGFPIQQGPDKAAQLIQMEK